KSSPPGAAEPVILRSERSEPRRMNGPGRRPSRLGATRRAPQGDGDLLTGGQRRRRLHVGDALDHRLLHLLDSADFDRTHALARHAELFRELLERDRLLGEAPRLEDAALAIVQDAESALQRRTAIVHFLVRDEGGLLVIALVNEPILPLAGVDV